MNQVKYVEGLNKRELLSAARKGGAWELKGSWHEQYKDSAYVFAAGFPYEMTEGDLIVVFSQYGEVVDVNLARDKKTGKSRGFAFLAYEDQRSTVLAVDNFNGAKLLGRTLRVDHCEGYGEEQERASKLAADGAELSAEERDKEAERLAHNEAVRARRDAKAAIFAHERGVLSAEEAAVAQAVAKAAAEREERERAARERMRARIEETRRAHREAIDAELGEEQRREREYREKKARRAKEAIRAAKQLAAGGPPPAGAGKALMAPLDNGAPAPPAVAGARDDADARFSRLFGGGKRSKGAKKAKRDAGAGAGAQADGAAAEATRGDAERPAKRSGEDAITVDETNAMRAQLGLPPLR
ncbi:hypothetical protein KFE25_002621 [Diacronema lutheri]|uniref:RRM domain-containing protein n=2 Tax=Diacronema lutheri TaxID=2081491 RepID=A0A8J5XLF0_DIALT|nr:hypothetical protein KFE25_002621 [Diacronema lutheri]